MAAKKPVKETPKRSELYTVDKQGKAVTAHRNCPRCGAGVFMGEHKDRFTCGKCGYTEFKQ
ncbi:MAG: 30S ribosomal protein S27ae [Methanocorpusculum sp.]|jgi:small subunit ribosomal protein S27Ae|nr:30S ribosomal protein S27ae [Methanocorpusculum sp.]MDD2470531.1 30S ribosomal protein S27ae [Methanocorpusculum sp.]MDD3257044.1 30S ribosomal protein S27ae [Methanocorpusculum sp.]MDD4132837.1 30S ribosomal protein S27ae [Methanocorpusculum sp.]